MAALKSILEFTFNSEPALGSTISAVFMYGASPVSIPMVAVETVTDLNQYALAPSDYTGSRTAFAASSYADAMITNQSFETSLGCTITANGSKATIIADYYYPDFTDVVVPTGVTYYYSRSSFTIDNITATQAVLTDFNNKARFILQVSNGVYPMYISGPVYKEVADYTELIFEWDRNTEAGLDYIVTVVGADGRSASRVMPTVDKISYVPFVRSTAFKAVNPDDSITLTITAAIVYGDISVDFSYSIDNVTWQSSNVFELAELTEETAYIKDNLGTFVAVPITTGHTYAVTGVEISNSILGARVEILVEFDGDTIPLDYSLGGINWQTHGVFTNVQSGDHIAYVRDDVHPVTQYEFTIPQYEFIKKTRIEGFYDYTKDEYGVKIPGEGMWHFSHTNQGWTHKIEASPDMILYDGLGLYSFDGQDLYKHGELTDGKFNIFYGAELPISFEISANDGYSDVKTLHSLFIEGNKGIVEIKDQKGDITTIPEVLFENKEGNWHAFIPMNSISSDSINMIGLGVVISNDILSAGVLRLNFGTDLKSPQVGDVIKATGASGDFSVKDGNSITITSATSSFEGKFAYIERNNIISGDYMRGNYFLLKFTVEDSTQNINVFAINLEAKKSNV